MRCGGSQNGKVDTRTASVALCILVRSRHAHVPGVLQQIGQCWGAHAHACPGSISPRVCLREFALLFTLYFEKEKKQTLFYSVHVWNRERWVRAARIYGAAFLCCSCRLRIQRSAVHRCLTFTVPVPVSLRVPSSLRRPLFLSRVSCAPSRSRFACTNNT